MPFRIRMRAGEVVLEVDTVEELVRVPIGFARDVAGGEPPSQRLLTTGAAAPSQRRKVGRRRGAARAARKVTPPPVARESRDAAPGTLADDDVLAILKRGPVSTGAIALLLRVPRPRVTDRLNGLAARGLAHATGQTMARRWHFGPATPETPARRSL